MHIHIFYILPAWGFLQLQVFVFYSNHSSQPLRHHFWTEEQKTADRKMDSMDVIGLKYLN